MSLGEAVRLGQAIGVAVESMPAPPSVMGTAAFGSLTQRERDVVAFIGRGCTNRQIAEALVISESTAAVHVKHIMRKLDCTSRSQVAVLAAQHGLVATAA
jgi:two-component system nitrate/nitrite response regulator NarL